MLLLPQLYVVLLYHLQTIACAHPVHPVLTTEKGSPRSASAGEVVYLPQLENNPLGRGLLYMMGAYSHKQQLRNGACVLYQGITEAAESTELQQGRDKCVGTRDGISAVCLQKPQSAAARWWVCAAPRQNTGMPTSCCWSRHPLMLVPPQKGSPL